MKPARFVCLFLLLASTLLGQSSPAPLTNLPTGKSAAAARSEKTLPTTQHPRGISPQVPTMSFAPTVTYGSGGIDAEWVSVADVNADGKPDLIVANESQCNTCTSGGLGVLLGNGDGTFQTAVAYGSGGGFWGNDSDLIAIADVNGDGKPDLVVANFCPDSDLGCYGDDTDGTVSVLLGNGDGTFQTAVPYDSGAPGALSVAIGDVTGDGIPDVVVGNLCSAGSFCESTGSWSVLPGNGNGTFQSPLNYESGYYVGSAVLADLNGDGTLDEVLAFLCGTLGECSSGSGGGVSVYGGDKKGGVFPSSVAVADVNGDGKPDVIVANECGTYKNGKCSADGAVGVLLNNGNGTFQTAVPYSSGGPGSPGSVAVGDLNGDGIPDIAVVNGSGVGILLGNGDGTFQAAVNYGSSGYASVAVADVNGDGKPDLLVANANNMVGVLLNTSIGPTTTTLTSSQNPSNYGQAVTFSVEVVSRGFKSTPTGTVNFYDGTTNLGSSNLSSAVATLTTSTLVVGTHSITATYNGDSNFGASTSPVLSQVVQGAIAVVSPSSLNFGNQTVGNGQGYQTVTLTNTGNAALTISSIAISLSNGGYAKTTTCGSSLAAGANCIYSLTWNPGKAGNMTGSITFTDNAPGSPQIVSLSGVGVVPTVTLSPTSLTFATQVVFTTSAAQTVTLSNTGAGLLTISGIAVTGAFTQTNTCGTQVAAGASCTFTVKFTPTTSGSLTGSVSITDNASGSPQKITLTGTGTDIQFTPTSLNFGNQPVGTTSLAKKITLSNKASVTVSITSISITGTDKKDFAETNTCGASVKAGASCTITVTFTPSADGKRTADVSADDNGGGSPQTVALSGTGTGT
jgi:hypothetical protein